MEVQKINRNRIQRSFDKIKAHHLIRLSRRITVMKILNYLSKVKITMNVIYLIKRSYQEKVLVDRISRHLLFKRAVRVFLGRVTTSNIPATQRCKFRMGRMIMILSQPTSRHPPNPTSNPTTNTNLTNPANCNNSPLKTTSKSTNYYCRE